MLDTEIREGWHWPVGDKGAWEWVYQKDYDLPQKILRYVSEFDLCVNAGSHVGVYAKQYAKVFSRVLAVEPELTNFFCLVNNLPEENVSKLNCALGSRNHWCSMIPPCNGRINSGGYTVGEGNSTPVLRIDDLVGSAKVGLIHLDVEGFESEVLFGGAETLTRDRPVVCLETIRAEQDKPAADFLKSLGYKVAERLPHDTIFTRA